MEQVNADIARLANTSKHMTKAGETLLFLKTLLNTKRVFFVLKAETTTSPDIFSTGT